MKDKIVVIGSSNVDMIMKMNHLPELGETVTDADFYQKYGGKGANQAVGAVRAGGKDAFVNCVGEDAYTRQMVQNYKNDGMDISYIFHEKNIASGHALVMIGDAGHNYLSVAPGANYLLTPEKINVAMSLIEKAAIIILQYEIPVETIKYIIDLANQKGIPVQWNFAPARDFDMTYIGKTNILIVNEIEAEFLSDVKITDESTAELAAKKIMALGSKLVIITLGDKGAMAFKENKKYIVPAFKVNAIDTTAAGDVFCGSFAVALIEKKSMKDALKFANAAAAICVTKMGAQESAPTRKEIDAFLVKQ